MRKRDDPVRCVHTREQVTMTAAREYTSEQIQDAITKAIRDRELEVVPGLIRLLALQDPAAAQAVLDAVELARTLSAAEDAVEASDTQVGVNGPATPVEALHAPRVRQQSASCSGCGARWRDKRWAHCSAAGCHRTFATASLFDRHRRGFACVDPATIPEMRLVDGLWRGPEMSEEAKLARFGGRP